jgi:diguanylate cyclase (GGDEF)-like protein
MCALIYPQKNALMYQIALKSAYRDPLTGLNNRTSMEKYLPREIDLAKRHSQSMALLVMDLDGFKQINDQCGHDVGDHVLREVGQVISHVVRNTDLVYRYGGDEFVGGLAQTDLHGAIDVCERIRASIDELDLKDYGVNRKVQVSIGITLVRTATGRRQ